MQAVTDAEVRYVVLARVLGSENFTFESAAPESTRHQNGVRIRKIPRRFLWPLDQANGRFVEIIARAGELQFFRVGETIQIKVVASPVLKLLRLHQGIGRTGHGPLVAHRTNQRPCKRRFPGPEFALEQERPARRVRRQDRVEFCGELRGRLRVLEKPFHGLTNCRR